MTNDQATHLPGFAGDLFLRLAAEGRLVLDPGVADETIAALERTLHEVRTRLQILGSACNPGQETTGRLEEAAIELPKYIDALRRARGGAPEDPNDELRKLCS